MTSRLLGVPLPYVVGPVGRLDEHLDLDELPIREACDAPHQAALGQRHVGHPAGQRPRQEDAAALALAEGGLRWIEDTLDQLGVNAVPLRARGRSSSGPDGGHDREKHGDTGR